ncbi:hypothetical protein [Streptomyces microflavus]|uniref:hypothetical protein n=1 Tax=Streptomyces microflavus TaxID=1919 RepID=UPI00365F144C
MNPPKQPHDHWSLRHHVARDLLGLFLSSAGIVGLVSLLYAAAPLPTLFLGGLVLTAGGRTILRSELALHWAVRGIGGYFALVLGSAILISIAVHLLTPWVVLFGLVLALGVYLSKEA